MYSFRGRLFNACRFHQYLDLRIQEKFGHPNSPKKFPNEVTPVIVLAFLSSKLPLLSGFHIQSWGFKAYFEYHGHPCTLCREWHEIQLLPLFFLVFSLLLVDWLIVQLPDSLLSGWTFCTYCEFVAGLYNLRWGFAFLTRILIAPHQKLVDLCIWEDLAAHCMFWKTR